MVRSHEAAKPDELTITQGEFVRLKTKPSERNAKRASWFEVEKEPTDECGKTQARHRLDAGKTQLFIHTFMILDLGSQTHALMAGYPRTAWKKSCPPSQKLSPILKDFN